MSTEPAGGASYRRAPRVLHRRLLDGMLVLPVDADDPLHISAPGDAVWALLAEPATMSELVDSLREVFDVSADQLVHDIGELLAVLVDVGAVVVDQR